MVCVMNNFSLHQKQTLMNLSKKKKVKEITTTKQWTWSNYIIGITFLKVLFVLEMVI